MELALLLRARETLFISFWNITLENFPVGHFMHQLLTAEEAKALIDQAKNRQCVAADDIIAPYKKRKREEYRDLCTVLAKHYNIELGLTDFTVKEEDGISTIFPLDCIKIGESDKLLVVSCNFTLEQEDAHEGKIEDCLLFPVSPKSVTFHLFSQSM